MGIFKKKKDTDTRSVEEIVFVEAQNPEAEKKEESKGFFAKLKSSLSKTGGGLLSSVFNTHEKIDADFYDELEEAMILADMGLETTQEVLDSLRQVVKAQKLTAPQEAREALVELLANKMQPENEFLAEVEQAVILIVGVNGVGKTTSIGKLSNYYKLSDRSVVIAAADTFRAAAAEQLTKWAERADVPIIKHGEGADPAAVVFDAIASFKAKHNDILICDTAGRLHNKKNLMNELAKIRRVISRELPDTPVEVLLVLDATTGQNAVLQAQAFAESSGLTGLIITKLDGTAKGGIAVSIKDMLNLPIRFIGVGEGIDDMRPFDAYEYARALIGEK
ncbi:MAG TPA: signal recognition particle-docking protein FtsY [Clostridiales bacterium]|nr:signal recognition particle-docking protein FtsY [Clostridiales bacterium]